VKALTKCIGRDLSLTMSEREAWTETKEKGLDLFAPERGGSHEVFNTRPLSEDVMLYCIQDVHFMPKLWRHYSSKMAMRWAAKVRQATKERTASSQTTMYNGKGQHKVLGPSGWA
jgi:exonuclease 3'-5' domain-containing protein 1